ncbi:hypothetical protein BGZ63DRAFT_401407 [Mariannaea sp. PMI_226]|nr:hypothetical protein BGZ63DRAFT_401407 [Mariannaea sp. PMI_226]
MAAWFSSEAFLPSGAFDADVIDPPFMNTTDLSYRASSSAAIATPSSSFPPSANRHNFLPYLPQQQQAQPAGRIPPASSFPRQAHDSGPLSLSSLRAAQFSSLRSPPEHLHVNAASSSLRTDRFPSSQTTPLPNPGQRLPESSTTPLSSIPQYLAGASLSRSVSADAAPPSQQTSVYMVQRLVQQNALIREAWEAERNYLEANRRRAEEVYQEDRALMDDVRQMWDDEKAIMLNEIESLKQRLFRLEGENSTLKSIAVQVTGVVSPVGSQRGSGDVSMDSSYFSTFPGQLPSRSQNPVAPNSFSATNAASLPLASLDGASHRASLLSPRSSRTSPTRPLVAPLDPRTQPEKSTDKDFLSSPSDDSNVPIPVIDVQEIDPNLEGIPIKTTAVQRSTFNVNNEQTELESSLSPKTSTLTAPRPTTTTKDADTNQKPPTAVRLLSGENTPLVLSPAETKRLTMHAGHTPCHSLSLPPTKTGTETNSISGPSNTASPIPETTEDTKSHAREKMALNKQQRIEAWQEEHQDHPEPILEAMHDKPLTGPLMIKNIPAQDEIFWEAVNQKLKPISQGQDALPAVMRSSPESSEYNPDPEDMEAMDHKHTIKPVVPVGGDGSQDAQIESDGEDDGDTPNAKNMESEMPLKFRSTSNFGAPFGAL